MWTRIALAALALAPSHLAGQRLRTETNIIAPPPFLVASAATRGVQLTWGTAIGATQYLILRGPDATQLAQIGVLAAPDTVYQDGSNTGAATYQVLAVNALGRQAASPVAMYSPPAAITRTRLPTPTITAFTPPVVTSAGMLASPQISTVRNGDEVLVQGTGLDGLTSVMVHAAYTPYQGRWATNSAASAIAITPGKSTSTSFTFVPQLPVPFNLTQTQPYLVIVTKGTLVDTSDTPIFVAGKLPVRQITSVVSTVVRSGQRVKITGVGFDNVIGGYFGGGTQGSVGNPLLTMWNRSPTYVELATPTSCDMEGILMLEQPQTPAESPYIIGTTPIRVTCVPGNPTGTITSPSLDANKVGYAMPGSKIQITGKYLRYVTRVIDQRNAALPFTLTTGMGSDFLTVTLPPGAAGAGYGFSLENSLTDPVLSFTVTGSIVTIGPPELIRFETAWAEPGQMVYVVGRQLKWNAQPKVYVGGVPAQIASATATQLSFRMPTNAVSGPVEVENEGGRVRFDGPYPIRIPQVTHTGFFVVAGPSVVTQVVTPRPTVVAGDTLTVIGQNLARLGGICLQAANGQGYLALRRPEAGGSAPQGWISSNTSMLVVMQYQPNFFGPGPVQLYANAQPIGDSPPIQFACAPNPQMVNWP